MDNYVVSSTQTEDEATLAVDTIKGEEQKEEFNDVISVSGELIQSIAITIVRSGWKKETIVVKVGDVLEVKCLPNRPLQKIGDQFIYEQNPPKLNSFKGKVKDITKESFVLDCSSEYDSRIEKIYVANIRVLKVCEDLVIIPGEHTKPVPEQPGSSVKDDIKK